MFIYAYSRCAPPQSKSFSIRCTPKVHYKITPPVADKNALPYPLGPNTVLLITMDTVSETAFDSKVNSQNHPCPLKTIDIKSKPRKNVWKFSVLSISANPNECKQQDKMLEKGPKLTLGIIKLVQIFKRRISVGLYVGSFVFSYLIEISSTIRN